MAAIANHPGVLPAARRTAGPFSLPPGLDHARFGRHKGTDPVDLALHWVRRRQRALARGVLAVFCLAWLQAAVVPCAMASAGSATMPDGGEHCVYCPPSASTPSAADHGGTCAYPHEPQVDARASAALFMAIPVASFAVVLDAVPRDIQTRLSTLQEPVPRVPIQLSFCRYLE
jgi:hypothetical protein